VIVEGTFKLKVKLVKFVSPSGTVIDCPTVGKTVLPKRSAVSPTLQDVVVSIVVSAVTIPGEIIAKINTSTIDRLGNRDLFMRRTTGMFIRFPSVTLWAVSGGKVRARADHIGIMVRIIWIRLRAVKRWPC
jgi:hypothetical protein